MIVVEIFERHSESNCDNKIQSLAKSRNELKQIDVHEINCSRQSLFLRKNRAKNHDIQSLIVESKIVENFELFSNCNRFWFISVTRFRRSELFKFYRLIFIESSIWWRSQLNWQNNIRHAKSRNTKLTRLCAFKQLNEANDF